MRRATLAIALVVTLLAVTQTATRSAPEAVLRWSAEDNVDAAIAISREVFSEQGDFEIIVLLARDDTFPDALASSPLQTWGPLLYTPTSALDPRTAEEIERLNASAVWILGGEDAISPAVEQDLRSRGYDVNRYSGVDRIETAVKLAEEFALGTPEFPLTEVKLARAFPAAGSADSTAAFVDSLAIGLRTSFEHTNPVLLSHTEVLSPATAALLERVRDLQDAEVDEAFVAGGPAALSDQVVADTDARTNSVIRLAGSNRFATAVAIAEQQERDQEAGDWKVDAVVIADGTRPDAWAPGFAAASIGVLFTAVMVLVDGETLPPASRAYLESFDGNRGQTYGVICLPYVTPAACDRATEALPG